MTKQHIPPNVWIDVPTARITCGQCGGTITLKELCPHFGLCFEDGELQIFQPSGQNQTITVTAPAAAG